MKQAIAVQLIKRFAMFTPAKACYQSWSVAAIAMCVHCAGLLLIASFPESGRIDDLGFNTLPRIASGYGELLPYTFLLATLARLCRRGLWSQLWQFSLAAAAIMVFRTLCVTATILPASDPSCQEAVGVLAILRGGCRDKVFSGHVAYMTLSALHLREVLPRGVAWPLVAAEATYLVAAREHYTVDVLVAVPIALLASLSATRWVTEGLCDGRRAREASFCAGR